jgi:hypothetical protein
MEGTLHNSFYEAIVIFIEKTEKGTTNKKHVID